MANKLNGWAFELDLDSNYPDNMNITFIKPNNDKLTKDDLKEVKKVVKKLALDQEPIMEGMYSFDALTVEMVRRECLAAGMTERVEVSTYVPDFSEPKEEPNDNVTCSDSCDSCGGGCGSTP
jgi:hypothetical protein